MSHVESNAGAESDGELDDTAEMSPDPRSAEDEGYAPLHDASVYELDVDPAAENDAHSIVIRLAGENKRVLELGCATGSTTKVLQERGCRVVGMEIDADAAQVAEQFAERVIVADLDLLNFEQALGDDDFEVIIAADVLEHLRNPLRVMRACVRHLRAEGEVLLSIPNIAHADARLALLGGEFDYREWGGLLDETHLRFFTRQSLETFLDDCGLVALDWDRTHRPVGGTEITWRPPYDDSLIEWVAQQPDADTYQFIVRAAAAPVGSHLHQTGTRLRELLAESSGLRTQVERMTADVAELSALVQAASESNTVIAELRVNLQYVEERYAEDLATTRNDLAAIELGLRDSVDELVATKRERDDYRSSFEALVGVQEQLIEVRRSESFRLGRALLAPAVTARRLARAWRRAKPTP